LSRVEAAAYVGVSPERFDQLVAQDRMPLPKAGMDLWDRLWIDTARRLLGEVYVAGFHDFVKIGITKNVARRMRQLDQGLPAALILYAHFPGGAPEEAELFARFHPYRLRGEWFRKEGSLATWIDEGCRL
jgi:hypothetical protein